MEIDNRKLLLAAFGVSSIFIFLKRGMPHRNSELFRILGFLLFIISWVVLIPAITHGMIVYSFSDSLPLIAVGVFLCTVDFAKRKNEWIKIRKMILWLISVFALLHLVLYGMSRIAPESIGGLQEFLTFIWESSDRNENRFVFLNPMDQGVLRVYFGSSFLLLLGLYFSAQKYKSPLFKSGFVGLFVFILTALAIWSTDTRSLMLGAVSFILLFTLFDKVKSTVRLNSINIFFLLILPFLLSFIVIMVIDPRLLEVFGAIREGSDDLRVEQFWPLLYSFLSHPIFGRGFGASVSVLRIDGAPYTYELSILALFMKIGLAGLLLVFGVLSSAIYSVGKNDFRYFPRKIIPLYCLYFSYIMSCIFNPYMFGLFGTFFSLFLLYEYTFLMENREND